MQPTPGMFGSRASEARNYATSRLTPGTVSSGMSQLRVRRSVSSTTIAPTPDVMGAISRRMRNARAVPAERGVEVGLAHERADGFLLRLGRVARSLTFQLLGHRAEFTGREDLRLSKRIVP